MTVVEQSYRVGGLYARLTLLAAGLFVAATNSFLIAGLLPDISGDFGVHPSDVSLSITWYSATVAVAAPAISMLFPRAPRTALMALGLVAIGIGTAIAAVSDGLPLFIAGRVLAGLGAAALVPTATASAAALAPPERRGRAIGYVVIGFTAATAFGAPLATALSAGLGWHVPMLGLAVLALLIAGALALTIRGIPLDPPVTMGQRMRALADPRLLLAILTTVFAVAGFNIVYIFSSQVAADATGGDGGRLAILLLIFGVAGIAGNTIGGQLTDRIGPRLVGGGALGVLAVLLAIMPLGLGTLVGAAILFGLWGLVLNTGQPAIQYRQLTVEPSVAGIAVSWSSTALYLGIAIAPPLGALALQLGGAHALTFTGAALAGVALLVYLLSWVPRRP
jgi:predicted MFS family arabinose efflux permease